MAQGESENSFPTTAGSTAGLVSVNDLEIEEFDAGLDRMVKEEGDQSTI